MDPRGVGLLQVEESSILDTVRAPDRPDTPSGPAVSLWLRRTHLYAALFLVPWVVIYATSTLVMNHSSHFPEPASAPVLERVSTQKYDASFPPGASADQIVEQLLADLGLAGKHRFRHDRRTGVFVIDRDTPRGPRRITYDAPTGDLTVEAGSYGLRRFMAQIHRRRGYESDAFKEDAYGFFVDAFLVVMLFWVLSGIWMWWEMRATRMLGWVSLGGGVVLFLFFLLAI